MKENLPMEIYLLQPKASAWTDMLKYKCAAKDLNAAISFNDFILILHQPFQLLPEKLDFDLPG